MKNLILIFFSLLVTNLVLAKNIFPVNTSSVKLHYSNKEDLKEAVEDLTSNQMAEEILDKIDNAKIELRLLNDYNFTNPNSGDGSKSNDDIGRTHGFKISIFKNIAPISNSDKYYIGISYQTELYTNSDQPTAFQNNYYDVLYKNESGYWQADVYFKEENIFKLIAGKIKSKDAYYWKLSGGYHEINADDADRGILISSITQQAWHHHSTNRRNGATYREYNYMGQGELEAGLLIDTEIGRDFTIHSQNNTRSFIRVGTESRLTKVKDASFVGTYFQVGYDYSGNKSDFIPAFRVIGAINAKRFQSSTYTESYIEASVQGQYVGAKFRYIVPLTDDPEYLNALPKDFTDRDNLAAPSEPMIWLNLEGKLPY